jgi:hypothetical protein
MTRLLIGILATWRISSLLVSDHETGPFDLFGRLRDAVGVNYTADSRRVGSNELARVFTCIWCMSVWVGWIVALAQSPKQWFVRGLAYSAGAIIMEKVTHG